MTGLCCEPFLYGLIPNPLGGIAMTAWDKFVAKVLKLFNKDWHDRWVGLCVTDGLKSTRGT